MRWLVRSLLFWAISLPLFYLFVLPYLLDMLSKKAQDDGYTQCAQHLESELLMGKPNSPMTTAQGEKYCHCMSDGLILTKNDVFDLVQHKPPAGLNALSAGLSQTCNQQLQQEIAPTAPAAVTPGASGQIPL